MAKKDREFNFNERGIPTLAKAWDGSIPAFKKFEKNESGRRARGQLEDMVDVLCKVWIVKGPDNDQFPDLCYATWLAKMATSIDGIHTSPGAIAGILQKWEKIGYATIGIKPSRFIGYTKTGMELGLDEIYRRGKFRKTRHYQWPDK